MKTGSGNNCAAFFLSDQMAASAAHNDSKHRLYYLHWIKCLAIFVDLLQTSWVCISASHTYLYVLERVVRLAECYRPTTKPCINYELQAADKELLTLWSGTSPRINHAFSINR